MNRRRAVFPPAYQAPWPAALSRRPPRFHALPWNVPSMENGRGRFGEKEEAVAGKLLVESNYTGVIRFEASQQSCQKYSLGVFSRVGQF